VALSHLATIFLVAVTPGRDESCNINDPPDILLNLSPVDVEDPDDEDIGAFFVTKAAEIVAPEVLERQEEAEARKCTLIASFGDYVSNKWCPALIIISRYVALLLLS